VWLGKKQGINDDESGFVTTGANMSGSKPACVKSALSAKELWWSAGCSAVSPTALAPPTVPAGTAPIINSPGRKKAKPCRGGYRPSTLPSTGNGSPTVSASSRSFSRCTEFHKKPTATCCRLKKPKKAARNQGIFLPHLDNPGVSGHLRGGNAQNRLIFRGFSRCQKVATPNYFASGHLAQHLSPVFGASASDAEL